MQPTYDAESGNWIRATLVGGDCSISPLLSKTIWKLLNDSSHYICSCNYESSILSRQRSYEHGRNLNWEFFARVEMWNLDTLFCQKQKLTLTEPGLFFSTTILFTLKRTISVYLQLLVSTSGTKNTDAILNELRDLERQGEGDLVLAEHIWGDWDIGVFCTNFHQWSFEILWKELISNVWEYDLCIGKWSLNATVKLLQNNSWVMEKKK